MELPAADTSNNAKAITAKVHSHCANAKLKLLQAGKDQRKFSLPLGVNEPLHLGQ